MLLFNIVLVLALIAFTGLGLSNGFIKSLGKILGAILGFIAARAWYVALGSVFAVFMPTGWARFIAFILIFGLVDAAIGWIFGALDKTYKFLAKLPGMKALNSVLGGLLGFIEGVVFLGGAIWLLRTFAILPFILPYVTQGVANWIYFVFIKVLGILL